jgi:hypothetical protein
VAGAYHVWGSDYLTRSSASLWMSADVIVPDPITWDFRCEAGPLRYWQGFSAIKSSTNCSALLRTISSVISSNLRGLSSNIN